MYNLMDARAAMRADGRPYTEEAAEAQRVTNGEVEWDENKVAAMNLVPMNIAGWIGWRPVNGLLPPYGRGQRRYDPQPQSG